MANRQTKAVTKLSLIQLLLMITATTTQAKLRQELFIVPPGEHSPMDARARFNLSQAPVECVMSMPFLDRDFPGLAQYYGVGARVSPQDVFVDFQEAKGPCSFWLELVDKDWGEVATAIFINGNGKQASKYSNNLHVHCYQNLTNS